MALPTPRRLAPRSERTARRKELLQHRPGAARGPKSPVPPVAQAPATLEKPWKTLGRPWGNDGIARRSRAPEISETLENLGKPWENLGMVSGDIWAEARQRAGQEQTKGNIKEIQWSEGQWQNLGISSGKPWKTLETVGRPWETVENPWEDLGRPWENLGKPLGNPWKTLEKPWNRPAADFWMTAAGAWSKGEHGNRCWVPYKNNGTQL
eukprot:gene17479-biopygen5980